MITINRPKIKLNPLLIKVITISLIVHLVAGFIAGFITITNYVMKEDVLFDVPPPLKEEKVPTEVKVVIKPQSAPQQNIKQQLKMKAVGNIAVAQVDVDLPSMEQGFTVSAGLGGLGGGSLLSGTRGSIGIGLSEVNIFGLKTRAERILFVIDANRRMLTDAKGGLNSYNIIKDEVSDMVGNLSAGTLFNVMLYDHRNIKRFKSNLVPSGSTVHNDLVTWISKINSDSNQIGLSGVSGVERPRLTAFKNNEMQDNIEWSHGFNDTAFITQVALEQNADTIFIITGYHRGFDTLAAPPSAKRLQEWEDYKSSEEFTRQVALYDQEVPDMRNRIDNELAKINSDRTSRGLPARVLRTRRDDVRGNANELGLKWRNPHPPGGPGHEDIDRNKGIQYFKELLKYRFTDKGAKSPSMNVVLFLAGDEEYKAEWENNLKSYTNFFQGRNRILRGANEIRSARSATDVKN